MKILPSMIQVIFFLFALLVQSCKKLDPELNTSSSNTNSETKQSKTADPSESENTAVVIVDEGSSFEDRVTPSGKNLQISTVAVRTPDKSDPAQNSETQTGDSANRINLFDRKWDDEDCEGRKPDKEEQEHDHNKDLKIKLLATVSPPQIDGVTLQATSAVIVDDYVFTSYNVAGEVQKGGIDIIDISDRNKPRIVSEILFPDSDINSIKIQEDFVYAVGATSDPRKKAAFVKKIQFKDYRFKNTLFHLELESFAAVDLEFSKKKLLVLSGSNGGLTMIDSGNFKLIQYLPFEEARAIDVSANGKQIRILSGMPGKLHVLDEEGEEVLDLNLLGANTAESKATLLMKEKISLLALGEGGISILCNKDNNELLRQPAIILNNLHPSKSVSNAAVISSNTVFSAHGEAGIYVSELNQSSDSCRNDLKMNVLGSINFGNSISANHVILKGKTLVAAAGLGGFKLMEISRE